jgi:phytoene/squalene synthetase
VLALHGIGTEAWPSNDALCNALQIINHIQDCADDYRELDRVYVPQDMLAANNASTADLACEKSTPGLRATLTAMLDCMQPMMAEARKLPRHVPDWRLKCETSVINVLAARLVALLYNHDPLCEDVKLNKISVLGATLQGIGQAWF